MLRVKMLSEGNIKVMKNAMASRKVYTLRICIYNICVMLAILDRVDKFSAIYRQPVKNFLDEGGEILIFVMLPIN